jgi:predicted GIY-YIG superfamily endonuclease
MRVRDTVYVIESESATKEYYIGLTADIAARVKAHNAGGSRHTSKYRPWRLVVTVTFADPTPPVAIEKYLN